MDFSKLDIVYIKNAFVKSGYVFDFSNDSFQQFTVESVGIDIQNQYGDSKGKSLIRFFEDPKVGIQKKIKMLKDLLEYNEIYESKPKLFPDGESHEEKAFRKTALEKCRDIVKNNSGIIVESDSQQVKEIGLKKLIEESKKYFQTDKQVAVEKAWDALERLKTYYGKDKDKAVPKLVDDMSHQDTNYNQLFTEEFRLLSKIGNDYRIRHHEINKIEIIDDNYYDYFYNRCMALIDLAIRYLI